MSSHDDEMLEDFLTQAKNMEKSLLAVETRAKEAERKAQGFDRLWEGAEISLVAEKSSQEAMEKKYKDVVSRELVHFEDIKKLEVDVARPTE